MTTTTEIAFLCLFISSVQCSTHWVVTEEGKVQEQLESPFAINQPHDLMAFMKQETNYDKLQQIKKVLVVEKKAIEDNEDKELDLEEKHYLKDDDCLAAGKQLGEFDLFVSSVLPMENKDIEVSEYVDFEKPKDGVALLKPDCVGAYELPQGKIPYDEVLGVKNRHLLDLYQAETGLKTTLKYMDNEDDFAHSLATALKKNSSSWVVYNLATSYWRMKGEAEKAVECARRALHFSPAGHKDVALLGLANILHRSHYSINASVILEQALKVPDVASVIHFTLASIYAILGEFNLSIEYFEKTLAGQPDFIAAKKRLHAVRCQLKLQQKLEAQHESLQRTLRELEAYQEKHQKYVEVYQAIEKMQLNKQDQINMHFILMQYLIKEGTFDHKLCKFRSNELFCSLPKMSDEKEKEDDQLIPNINSGKKSEPSIEKDVLGHIDDSVSNQPTKFAAGDASGMFTDPVDIDKIAIGDWSDAKWPTKEHCNEYAPRTLAWDEYPSTYIDPETRGFSVRELLTTYIGIKDGENVARPWEELNCETLEPICEKTSLDEIQGIKDRHSGPMHKQDEYMTRDLLMHVNEGKIWPGDLEHRIHTAIKKSLENKDKDKNLWLLYNYAGLYFRVYGHNLKAVECIRRAMQYTPKDQTDVTLLNVANIMYRLGKINDALALLIDALLVNRTEPVTYLAIGNVLQAKGNISGAVTFYEYGLYLNNRYNADFYALMNVKCASKREANLKEQFGVKPAKKDSEASTNAEPEFCDGDGASCSSHSKLIESLKNAKNPDGHVYKTKQTEDGLKMFTVHSFSTQETAVTTECENISDETDLVRRLESTKEDADKILSDADAVIQRLSHVAKDSAEELSMRVSSARKIMHQLTEMRESLGSLVEEASTTLDVTTTGKRFPIKDQFTQAECTHALHNIDLRTFLSSNMDVSMRGYDFTEELRSLETSTQRATEPFCIPVSTPNQYNVDHLETIANREKFLRYDEEYGMELLLKQLLETENTDFSVVIQQLADGMLKNPASWRLAFLSSYYWRLKGKAKEAIDCLRLSLSNAPLEMRDIVLLSLANVFAQLQQWNDAIHVTRQALLLFPDYFLYHFTLANILAAMGDIPASIPSFRRALELQPGLDIAQRRFAAAVCEGKRMGIH